MAVSFEEFPVYKKTISFTVKIFKLLENENLNKECLEITKEVYHFIKYLEKSNLGRK